VLREWLGEPASAVGVLAQRVTRCTEQLRETLGSIRWAENQDRGRKMTAEDAILYALRELALLSRTATTAAVTAPAPGARPS